jgi:uncharacterized protein (DUF1778 family)
MRYISDMPETRRHHAMRVTTLRFGTDLWTLLEQEASAAGTSVSQYVREAALARAAASAGARGDVPYALLSAGARELAASPELPPDRRRDIELALASLARALARERRSGADALHREARQATARAKRLEKQLEKLR